MDRDEHAGAGHERTPFGLFSRTWELELFISGALVFALMQVPGQVDQFWERLSYDLGPIAFRIALLAYIYARAIVMVLVLAFLLNLGARAYWVGLIGLDSVFPGGIRWDNTRGGPIQRDVYRQYVPETRRLIALLDNFCSVTFSFAFVMVVLFVFSTGIISAIGVGVYLVTRALGREAAAPQVTLIVMLVFAGAMAAVGLADRWWGERLKDRPAGAVLRRLMHATAILQVLPLYGSTFMTLLTNLRARVVMPLLYAVMFGVIFAVFIGRIGEDAELSGDRYLPAYTGVIGVDYAFYQSHRPAGVRAAALPSIQSDIIREPYVRLFIPYNARRDNVAIERLCPDVRPLVADRVTFNADESPPPDAGAVRAVLACIAGYRDVRLDGAPLPDLALQFYREPRDGMEGTVAYIPVTGLAPGAHALTVRRTPRWESEDPPGAPPHDTVAPYTIRFWR